MAAIIHFRSSIDLPTIDESFVLDPGSCGSWFPWLNFNHDSKRRVSSLLRQLASSSGQQRQQRCSNLQLTPGIHELE